MLTDNTLIALGIAGAVVALTLILMALTLRYARAVAAAGPIAELAVYDRQLEEKRGLMRDLEEELEKRRVAMATVADISAEVDGLRRQRDELLTEWESLRARREEVQAVRQDAETAMIERQALEAELIPMRAEYLAIKADLDQARDLTTRIATLNIEHQSLSDQVAALSAQAQDLSRAEARLSDLSKQAEVLERKNKQLDGRIAIQDYALSQGQERLDLLRSETQDLRAQSQTVRIELQNTQSALVTTEAELRGVHTDVETLSDTRTMLEARLAVLRSDIAKAEGHSGASGAQGADPLRELKVAPPVITEMQTWDAAPRQNEADAITSVKRRLRAEALDYPDRTIRAFHTAMKVNDTTQMTVLSGISGTGKSQLPRQYAAAMGIGFLQVPVQPRWDSPQDLMGFYNYIEGRFRPTDMARALWALDRLNNRPTDTDAGAIPDRMMMILLDEMNLARVEYYFSDFLSRLESRPPRGSVSDTNLRKDAEIELEIPNMDQAPRIFPGYNLLFAGTMNEDESTQSLSDKVVDRANILRFAAPNRIKRTRAQGQPEPTTALSQRTWEGWLRPSEDLNQTPYVTEQLDTMVALMGEFHRPFGHRLGRAILAYVANYPEAEGGGRHEALTNAMADQVELRLLPKLRGVDIDQAGAAFDKLCAFVERDLGDEVLAQAIKTSVEHSEATGQFVWSGAAR